MSGEKIIESMIPMHDRSNGLGGGFAACGIYPDYRDFYAFHIFFDSRTTRKECEALLKEGFEMVQAEHIPDPDDAGDYGCAADLAVLSPPPALRAGASAGG